MTQEFRQSFILLLLLMMMASGCGATSSDQTVGSSIPVLFEADPAQGSPGEEITLVGSGFSIVPAENIVLIGDVGVAALSFDALEEGLSINFVLPDETAIGETEILVLVKNDVSNAIPFEVLP